MGWYTDDIHEHCPIFKTPPTPLSIYVQNSSTPLTLDVQFQTNLPCPNDNQLKQTNPGMTIMLSGPFFR